MSFGKMPQQAQQPQSPIEVARQKYGVDLDNDMAVRQKAIELAVDSPKARELLTLWEAHQKTERPN